MFTEYNFLSFAHDYKQIMTNSMLSTTRGGCNQANFLLSIMF